MVSIVVPVYKAEKVIAETTNSALSQTYTDRQLLLVDDCSSDKSYEVIEPLLLDECIHYIKPERNAVAAARNKGIEAAQGRYTVFLDSDDVYADSKPENSIAFLCGNDAATICTDYEQMKENGEYTGRKIRCKYTFNYNTCLQFTTVVLSTVLYDQVSTSYRLSDSSALSNKFGLIKYQYRLFRAFEHFTVQRAAYQTAAWCVVKVLHIK